MTDTRTQLLTRKRDLFAALRLLERDHQEEAVDDLEYQATRARYQSEAAEILEKLDPLPTERPARVTAVSASAGHAYRWMIAGAVVVVALAVGLFLATALRPSGAKQATSPARAGISGQIPPQLARAMAAVRAHPRSADAQLELGNQWFQLGRLTMADGGYQRAERLAPLRPEPPTLHAWMVGLQGKPSRALTLLSQVERTHPAYARAWLIQGLVLAQRKPGLPHAIAAFQHFLRLQPHTAVSAEVRTLIANARLAEGKSR